jgi:hypothetical protein
MRFDAEEDLLPLGQFDPVSLSNGAAERLREMCRRLMIACLGWSGERNQIYPQTYEN